MIFRIFISLARIHPPFEGSKPCNVIWLQQNYQQTSKGNLIEKLNWVQTSKGNFLLMDLMEEIVKSKKTKVILGLWIWLNKSYWTHVLRFMNLAEGMRAVSRGYAKLKFWWFLIRGYATSKRLRTADIE